MCVKIFPLKSVPGAIWSVLPFAVWLLGGAGAGIAQTYHSGTISSNETWYAVGNPHIVTGNVTVNSGVTLAIEAGCQVMFDSGTRIYVNGILDAQGTSTDSIRFTRNGASVIWYGLQFNAYSSGDLDYCIIEYASGYPSAYAVKATSTDTLSLEHCILQHNRGYNGYGFWGSEVTPHIENCVFQDNKWGIYLTNGTLSMIGAGNLITDNDNGVRFHNCSAPQLASGNVISDNINYGVYFDNCTSLGTIDGLTLTGNGGMGLCICRIVEISRLDPEIPSVALAMRMSGHCQ
jgi:hypothetical protein